MTQKEMHKKVEKSLSANQPTVSNFILRTICGLKDGLEKNATFFSFSCRTLKSDIKSEILSRQGSNNGLQNPMK